MDKEEIKNETILVSACLIGLDCTWNGKQKTSPMIIGMIKDGYRVIPVCSEQLSGYGTPRNPKEIENGNGMDVLEGKCKVISKDGGDETPLFLKGAEEVGKIAELFDAKIFIGKVGPSCGCGKTYDGSFSGTLCQGDGVTAAYLRKKGLICIDIGELE